MKIASAQIKPYRRKLVEPLHTAHGEIKERYGFIVSVSSDQGHTGYGEIPMPLFAGDGLCDPADTGHYAVMKASVDSLVGKDIPSSLEDIEVDIEHLFPAMDSCVYFGLETALCDLAARIVGYPLSRWLSDDVHTKIPVNYLIRRPVDDWDILASIITKRGYSAVKAKVAVESVDEDVRFIEKLRTLVSDDITIRLDANRGWEFDIASDALQRMAKFGIDYIEEPLAAFDMDNLKKLRSQTGIPMALDESLAEIDDIDNSLSEKAADVLLLKPSIIGGVARTLDMVKRAAIYDCRCVITTNLETEIGTAAILHLTGAVPGDLPPCGLDTLRLLENADASLTRVENGAIELPSGNGLGIGEELWAGL